METTEFIDYLNNRLLKRFKTHAISFTRYYRNIYKDVNPMIAFNVCNNSTYISDYEDFFDSHTFNFFSQCEYVLKCYIDTNYFCLDISLNAITVNDLDFLRTMVKCKRCQSHEELEVKLDLLGYCYECR